MDQEFPDGRPDEESEPTYEYSDYDYSGSYYSGYDYSDYDYGSEYSYNSYSGYGPNFEEFESLAAF